MYSNEFPKKLIIDGEEVMVPTWYLREEAKYTSVLLDKFANANDPVDQEIYREQLLAARKEFYEKFLNSEFSRSIDDKDINMQAHARPQKITFFSKLKKCLKLLFTNAQ